MFDFLTIPAAVACIAAHESIGQIRKFGGRRYYTHPLTVATLVGWHAKNDKELFAAACLHDVLEDVYPKNPIYSPEWIAAEFGEDVLALVKELTNEYTKDKYPDMNRNTRKVRESERIAQISDRAKVIKRADLYHNSTEISPDRRFWDQWLKEKRVLDCILGAWEDQFAAPWLHNGNVYVNLHEWAHEAYCALQATDADELYKLLPATL